MLMFCLIKKMFSTNQVPFYSATTTLNTSQQQIKTHKHARYITLLYLYLHHDICLKVRSYFLSNTELKSDHKVLEVLMGGKQSLNDYFISVLYLIVLNYLVNTSLVQS